MKSLLLLVAVCCISSTYGAVERVLPGGTASNGWVAPRKEGRFSVDGVDIEVFHSMELITRPHLAPLDYFNFG